MSSHITQFSSVSNIVGSILPINVSIATVLFGTFEIGPKDGSCISFATFKDNKRASDNLLQRSGIALDVETSRETRAVPPSEGVAFRRLQQLGCEAYLWTTWSHEPDSPRYRVVVPIPDTDLTNDTNALLDRWLPAALAQELGLQTVVDASKFGADSLFFLPRHPANRANYRFAGNCAGPLIDLRALQSKAIALLNESELEQQAAIRQAMTMDPRTRAVIESFNKAHPVEVLLNKYGYRRRGRRWKSPHQSRDSAGATEIKREPDGTTRWVSFSESDRLAKLGMSPSRGGQVMAFGNSFDLFRHFEHRGNFKRAVAAAMNMNGVRHDRHTG